MALAWYETHLNKRNHLYLAKLTGTQHVSSWFFIVVASGMEPSGWPRVRFLDRMEKLLWQKDHHAPRAKGDKSDPGCGC